MLLWCGNIRGRRCRQCAPRGCRWHSPLRGCLPRGGGSCGAGCAGSWRGRGRRGFGRRGVASKYGSGGIEGFGDGRVEGAVVMSGTRLGQVGMEPIDLLSALRGELAAVADQAAEFLDRVIRSRQGRAGPLSPTRAIASASGGSVPAAVIFGGAFATTSSALTKTLTAGGRSCLDPRPRPARRRGHRPRWPARRDRCECARSYSAPQYGRDRPPRTLRGCLCGCRPQCLHQNRSDSEGGSDSPTTGLSRAWYNGLRNNETGAPEVRSRARGMIS